MAATVGSLLVNLETNVGKFAGDLGKASASVRNLDRGFGAFGRRVGGLGKQITAGVTLPILGWGAAAIQSNEVLNGAFRTIQSGTGASGAALDGLNNSFRAVFGSVPDGAAAVSSAIADLNTHTGATGATLETLTTALFKASRALGEDGATNAKAFGSALAQFEQPAARGAAVLDQMFVVSQNTGVSLSGLIGHTTTFGSVLKNAGFTIEESAAIFGSFESVGISVSRIMPGLNKAFRGWAGAGLDAKEMLFGTVDAMRAAESDTVALSIATEAFGAEGAQRMTTAVRAGTFAIENFTAILGDSSGAVDTATAKSATMSEVFATLRNKAVLAFEPLGADLRAAVLSLVPVVEALAARVSDAVTWFKNLDPTAKKVIVVVAGMAAAAGPLLIVFAQVAAAIPAIVFTLKAFGLALAAVTSPIGLVVAAVGGLIAILWQFDAVRKTVGNGLAWLRDKVFGASEPVDDLGESVADATEPVETLAGDVAKLGTGAEGLAPPFDIATGSILGLGGAAADTVSEAQKLADTLSDAGLGGDVRTLEKAWTLLTPAMRANDLVLGRVTKSALDLIDRGGDLSAELETLGMAAWMAREGGVMPLAAGLGDLAMAMDATEAEADQLGNEFIWAVQNGFGPAIEQVDMFRDGIVSLEQPIGDFHQVLGSTPSFFEQFSGAWGDVPGMITKSLMGGGSAVRAVGSHFGGLIGNALTTRVSAAIGGKVGQAIGGMFGPIGAMAGQFIGKGVNAAVQLGLKGLKKLGGAIKRLFGGPSEAEMEGRGLVAGFEDGIIAALSATQRAEAGTERWKQVVVGVRDAFIEAGKSPEEGEAAVQRLWEAIKQGPDAVRRVIAEIQPVLDQAGDAVDAQIAAEKAHQDAITNVVEGLQGLAAEGAETFEILPEQVQPYLDKLLEMGDLTEAQKQAILGLATEAQVDFKAMEAAAERYGIDLADLGPAFQGARIGDQARTIVEDFELLIASGMSVEEVIAAQGDAIHAVVRDSQWAGTEIPASMRPIIESMVEQGALTDANGVKVTDMAALNFAEPMTASVGRIITAIEDLILELQGATGKAEDLGNSDPQIDATLNVDTRQVGNIPTHVDIHARVHVPSVHVPVIDGGGGEGAPGFAEGTGGRFLDFGAAGTLVRLHNREMVVPEGQGVPVADLGFSGVEDRLVAIERLLLRQPQQLATATRDALIMTLA